MGNIFIFSLIIGFSICTCTHPLLLREKSSMRRKREINRQKKIGILITAIILLIRESFFVFYYFSNLDRNLSSLWIFATNHYGNRDVVSSGKKNHQILLCIGSLVVAIYFLTAFLFNADGKI